MVSNQMHGKTFEGIIKSCGLFSWMATDRNRSVTELFDIGWQDDKNLGIPTSIKSVAYKSNQTTISLSSALTFYRSFGEAPYRMIVGVYEQMDSRKNFFEVKEFIFKNSDRKVFFGSVNLCDLDYLHFGIGLKYFSIGEYERAREWAKIEKEKLNQNIGIVKLNPKIDSGVQRRLQCSVKLTDLESAFSASQIYTSQIGNIRLPITLVSSQREFK